MILLTIFALLIKMAASMNMEVQEKFLNLNSKEFIEYFNSQNFSWKITDYNQTFHFGSVQSPTDDEVLVIRKQCNVLLRELPKNFDARTKWPQCETIKEIYHQGSCASCWAFGTANSASDRTCIHKNIHVHLAEQDFNCAKNDVCRGAKPLDGFLFWQNKGLVTNKCKPYDVKQLKKDTCERKCVHNNMSYIGDKHYAKHIYGITVNINCIKSELVQNGPIEANFVVFQDFYKYRNGIYEHTFGDQVARHSVRVIGYGVENGKEYWLVANSWGEGFGEKGYFKIKMNQKNTEFEKFTMAGIPKN